MGLWDMELLKDSVSKLPFETRIINGGELPTDKGAIIFLAGGWCSSKSREEINELSDKIKQLPFALIFHTSDEGDLFDSSFLRSEKVKIWRQNAKPFIGAKYDRNILFSYTAGTLAFAERFKDIEKDILWSFCGQVTHSKREGCIAELSKRNDGYLLTTDGFAKGLEHNEYFNIMGRSKIVICPSGPVSPETFRQQEAMEFGCLPICDKRAPNWAQDIDYWQFAVGQVPFPTVNNWAEIHNILDHYIHKPEQLYTDTTNTCNWWQNYKDELLQSMINDIIELKGDN